MNPNSLPLPYINPTPLSSTTTTTHKTYHLLPEITIRTNCYEMPASLSAKIISKCVIYPDQSSQIQSLKLSVSDLPMLSCHYIQKGVLLTSPPYSFQSLVVLLKQSLSAALTMFPALAGRLSTDTTGHVHILCNDAGVDFIHAKARQLCISNVLSPLDVPDCFKDFFAYDKTLSYSGHYKPLMAVQVTELADGVFIGCTVNHAVVDGTSLWHFFNTFAAICKGNNKISKLPNFCRNNVFNSPAVLKFPVGGPKITFSGSEPLRERIFHFSRDSIVKLKQKANNNSTNNDIMTEIMGKQANDTRKVSNGDAAKYNGQINALSKPKAGEISSFQSLCAQLWRSVTRARSLPPTKTTTFRMAVNCRHRIEPKLDAYYFGNAIQSIPTYATAGELLSNTLQFGADMLHKNVVAYTDSKVRKCVIEWECNPKLFPLGNFDGAMITMGSSPRFPMYDNDFGWGRPVAVRSGAANKFDGKISAFPGREGDGSVDLEVVLAPATMAALENDEEFMQYVTEVVSGEF